MFITRNERNEDETEIRRFEICVNLSYFRNCFQNGRVCAGWRNKGMIDPWSLGNRWELEKIVVSHQVVELKHLKTKDFVSI